jgi:hypothetical protein
MRASHQHWNDCRSRERGATIFGDEIAAVAQALAEPSRASGRTDHREHAGGNAIVSSIEVRSSGWMDVLNVHEEAWFAAKTGGQSIAQATGVSARVGRL